ncbi:MAG: glycosyltransferase family 2 protein [Cetobacterium sp.]|uniref:glycosyltransferase family 2 protein n=1 Tax=Cetobacterium sp. TaxID=2071632 RepID=UPI003EE8149B
MIPKLTIAVAIYNLEDCLEKCLDSLLNQTIKKDTEILLINDGSTDSSELICKKYIEKGLNAKLINKTNGGLTSVRNFSIEKAQGEYILMIDGDDWLEINTIEIIFNNIEDVDLLCFGFNWIFKNKIVIDERFTEKKYYSENITNTIFKNEINTSVWNKVFKVDLLKQNKISFPEIRGAEDYIFVYDYLNICNKVKKITENLYNYYQRESSLSNEKSEEFYLNNLIVLERLIAKIRTNNQESQEFCKYILINYIYLIRDYKKKEHKTMLNRINEKRKIIESYLNVKKVLFLNDFRFKNKIRYLKIKGKNLC